jgi:hypothetical protein
MARKNAKKSVAAELKTQRGKKKLEGSTSTSRRTHDPKKAKAKDIPILPDSSSSDEIDEDYAEFLKTYDPQEFYPYGHFGSESFQVIALGFYCNFL